MYEIKIDRAWPSIVSEVQLNHAGGGEPVRLPVTFQYKKWRHVGGATTPQVTAD